MSFEARFAQHHTARPNDLSENSRKPDLHLVQSNEFLTPSDWQSHHSTTDGSGAFSHDSTAAPSTPIEKYFSNLRVTSAEISACQFRAGAEFQNYPRGSIQLFYVLHGQGVCLSGDYRQTIKLGDLLIVPNAMELRIAASEFAGPKPACIKTDERTLTLACVSISLNSSAALTAFDHLLQPFNYQGSDDHIRPSVELMFYESERQQIGARSIVESLAKNLLLLVLRDQLGNMRAGSSLHLLLAEPQIARVVNAITERPGERHTMENLARLAAMSAHTLSQRFEAIFAVTPNEFVQKTRLTAAEALLRSTDLPVKTIAGNVGFASRSHFSRLFSKHSGSDPTAYRTEHR